MEQKQNPTSKAQIHESQAVAPRSTGTLLNLSSTVRVPSVASDAEVSPRPCASAPREGRAVGVNSAAEEAGRMHSTTLHHETKAVSFRQRFQNFFQRYAGDVCGKTRESRIGPVDGPWEAVAIHSRLTIGHPSAATGGCSGLLWWHGGQAWGITHGSIIAPLLEVETEESLRDIMEMVRKRGSNDKVSASFERLELYVQREEYLDFDASVVDAWTCRSLSAAFDDLLSSGWDFFEEDADDLLKNILYMFVVFRPSGEAETSGASSSATVALATLLEQVHRGGLARGSPVLAVSSPFTGVTISENKTSEVDRRRRRREDEGLGRGDTWGPLLPTTDGEGDSIRGGGGRKASSRHPRSPFMNSWSQGVVSGVCGGAGDGSLFLTDARATGGSEGGPIFARDSGRGGKWRLAGMLLRSICYWRGEWVGFSLACYLEPTLRGFFGAKTGVLSMGHSSGPAEKEDEHDTISTISTCPVVLVNCGYTQGSGIPINGSQGLVLTCAHVVRKHHLGLKVTWLRGKNSVTKNAEVVYLTAPNLAYDIAVISVGPGTDLPTIHISQELPVQGDIVWLVGYAMHSRPSRFSLLEPPLLSRGIVSSVMPGNLPSLLQTTCCVQAGSSGGAVIREKDGTLLGVMVCNTAIEEFHPGSTKSKVIIHPNINFAIPAITLSDTLARFYKSEDPSVLNEFQSPDERVQQIWKLKVPELGRSKL